MVQCGSPELPDSNDESVDTSEIHVTNYGQDASDDSDDEGVGTAYDGYEPLPTTDAPIRNNHVNEEINTNDSNSDLPQILSSDAEISRQIWNEPRPPVLDLELDSSRAQQIMTAMTNIRLPNSAIPEWAESVPEERWKQDLLDRIRQRRDPPQNGEGPSQ